MSARAISLALLSSSLLLIPAQASADCGIELIEALKAEYQLHEAASSASYAREVLCSSSSSSSGSSASGGFRIPIEGVPFGAGMSNAQKSAKRSALCTDETFWQDASKVRQLSESLLDDNALEAYRICKQSPGLECSSYRLSEVDVEFQVSWTPFGSLSSVRQTGDAVLNNLTCQFPSIGNGHLYLGNVSSQAICEQTDPSRASSMTIPTNQGDYTCRISAAPGPSIHDLTLGCAAGEFDACDALLTRSHEASYRCSASARVPLPANATAQDRANAAQQEAVNQRMCTQIPTQVAGLRAVAENGQLQMAKQIAYSFLATLAAYGLD